MNPLLSHRPKNRVMINLVDNPFPLHRARGFPAGSRTALAQAKVDRLAADVTGYLNKWAVVVGCICVGFAVLAAAGDYTTRRSYVGAPGLGEQIFETTRSTNEKVSSFLEEARERVAASTDDAEKDLEAMREEVALKAKELEKRGKELESKDRTSWDLEVCSM